VAAALLAGGAGLIEDVGVHGKNSNPQMHSVCCARNPVSVANASRFSDSGSAARQWRALLPRNW